LTGTVLVITGIVIRKMMSRTSMTSTSGVVLMDAITPGSSPEPWMFIAITKSSSRPDGPAPRDARSRPHGTLVFSTLGSLTDRSRGSWRRARATDLGARGHSRAADQVRVQVAGEVAQRVLQDLVAAEQPVVAPHRGYRDEQAERSHDERATDGACHLVDAGLAGEADRDERVHDAPHRTEEANERSRGAHSGEEAQTL